MRDRLKRALVRVLHLFTWPLALPACLAARFGMYSVFEFGATVLSLIPGRIGQYLRASFYMQTLVRCHHDIAIGFLSFFTSPLSEVGRQVYVGSLCIIGNADIGDKVLVGSRTLIGTRKTASMDKVRIGYETWVGEGVTILADVGEACTIGAGAVVDEVVQSGCVAVGNPLRTLVR